MNSVIDMVKNIQSPGRSPVPFSDEFGFSCRKSSKWEDTLSLIAELFVSTVQAQVPNDATSTRRHQMDLTCYGFTLLQWHIVHSTAWTDQDSKLHNLKWTFVRVCGHDGEEHIRLKNSLEKWSFKYCLYSTGLPSDPRSSQKMIHGWSRGPRPFDTYMLLSYCLRHKGEDFECSAPYKSNKMVALHSQRDLVWETSAETCISYSSKPWLTRKTDGFHPRSSWRPLSMYPFIAACLLNHVHLDEKITVSADRIQEAPYVGIGGCFKEERKCDIIVWFESTTDQENLELSSTIRCPAIVHMAVWASANGKWKVLMVWMSLSLWQTTAGLFTKWSYFSNWCRAALFSVFTQHSHSFEALMDIVWKPHEYS